jgi:predicted DNA-binding protein (UPF0251 family)
MSPGISTELVQQIEDRTLGAGGLALLDIINACSDVEHLDEACRLIWKDWGEGKISDGESTYLVEAIQRRRPDGRRMAPGHATQIGRVNGRVISRFAPRQCRRRLSDDERIVRRMRKRRLGGSSALPDTLRHHFTEGERAVLCIIAFETKRHGVCNLSIDEIADRAGVGRTTVQNALHEARRLGLVKITERPVRGKKSLTNLVEVASHEWKVWIKRAPSAGRPIGSKLFKNVSTSKIIDIRKQESCNEVGEFDPPNVALSPTVGSTPAIRTG